MVPGRPGSSQCQEPVAQVLPHRLSLQRLWEVVSRSGAGTIPCSDVKLKWTLLVRVRDRSLLCPAVTGALCLQVPDSHLLIPWGPGAAVCSLPVKIPHPLGKH